MTLLNRKEVPGEQSRKDKQTIEAFVRYISGRMLVGPAAVGAEGGMVCNVCITVGGGVHAPSSKLEGDTSVTQGLQKVIKGTEFKI